jgi:hypothetical protein
MDSRHGKPGNLRGLNSSGYEARALRVYSFFTTQ